MESPRGRCYFFVLNGTRVGPVASEELVAFIVRNDVRATTLCWSKGMAQWTAASGVAEVAVALDASPPPLPVSSAPAALRAMPSPSDRISERGTFATAPTVTPSSVAASSTVHRKRIRQIAMFDWFYLLCFGVCYTPLLVAWIGDSGPTFRVLAWVATLGALAGVALFGTVLGLLAIAFVRRRWVWRLCLAMGAIGATTLNFKLTSELAADSSPRRVWQRQEQERLSALAAVGAGPSTEASPVPASEEFVADLKTRRDELERAFPSERSTTLIASAQKGDTIAMRELGLSYANGTGFETNDEAAVEWLARASQQGDVSATSALAWMHLSGRGVAQSEQEAIRLYHAASLQGDAVAQFSLALLKLSETNRVRDVDSAFSLLQSAAARGFTPAQSACALLALEASTNEPYRQQAIRQLKAAAEGGDPIGQYNYGLLMIEDSRDHAGDATGFRWLLAAAEQGLPDAQYAAGWAYATGRGPDRNDRLSQKWLELAASQGHENAKQALQRRDRNHVTPKSAPESSSSQSESSAARPLAPADSSGTLRAHFDRFVQSVAEGSDVPSLVSDLEGSDPKLMVGFKHLISEQQRASLAKEASLILNRRRNVFEACNSYAHDGWSNNRELYNHVRPVFQQYLHQSRLGALTQNQVVSFYTDFAARAEQACAECPPVGPVVTSLAQVHYYTVAFHKAVGDAMQSCGLTADASQQYDLALKHVDDFESNDRRASLLLQTSPDTVNPQRLRTEIAAARRWSPTGPAKPAPSGTTLGESTVPRIEPSGTTADTPRHAPPAPAVLDMKMPTRLLPLDWAGMFGFPRDEGSYPPVDPNDPNPNRTPTQFTPPDRETGIPPEKPGEWRDKSITVNCTGNWFQPQGGGDSGYFSTCDGKGGFSTTPTHVQLRASTSNVADLKIVIDGSATPDVSLAVGDMVVWLSPGEETVVPVTVYRRPGKRGDCLSLKLVVFYYRPD